MESEPFKEEIEEEEITPIEVEEPKSIMRTYFESQSVYANGAQAIILKHKATMRGELTFTFSEKMFTP